MTCELNIEDDSDIIDKEKTISEKAVAKIENATSKLVDAEIIEEKSDNNKQILF
jgi:hypothetical protein